MRNPVRIWTIGLIPSTLAVVFTILIAQPSASDILAPLLAPLIARLLIPPADAGAWAARLISEACIVLISGVLILPFVSRRVEQASEFVREQPVRSLIFGFSTALSALTFPVLAVWLGGAIGGLGAAVGAVEIGGLIALLTASAAVGTGGLGLAAVLLGGRIITGLALAAMIIPARRRAERRTLLARAGLALLLLTGIAAIPFFGWLISLIVSLIGAGALVRTLSVFNPMRPYAAQTDPARLPPPLIEDRPIAPGMDNLPSGFTWWE